MHCIVVRNVDKMNKKKVINNDTYKWQKHVHTNP